jgi:hypothetical protein
MWSFKRAGFAFQRLGEVGREILFRLRFSDSVRTLRSRRSWQGVFSLQRQVTFFILGCCNENLFGVAAAPFSVVVWLDN